MFMVGWTTGSKTRGRVLGNLSSGGLSCSALHLTSAGGPAPKAARPFRILRVAADAKAKTPEMMMIEVAAVNPDVVVAPPGSVGKHPQDNSTPKSAGFRIGPDIAQGFLPLLDIVPGRGVVVRGNLFKQRMIVRKPPSSEPSEAQLMQAFLRTDAGKKELARIESAATGLKITIPSLSSTDAGEQCAWRLDWKLENNQEMKLKRLKVMATYMIKPSSIKPNGLEPAPVFTELHNVEKTGLDKGEEVHGSCSVSGPKPAMGQTSWVGIMIAAEADYGIPVTQFFQQQVP
ncbi:hypothetical protein X770_00860 [Mesorhizobium sp. LSJC269B00]|nr:hypothetical protein X770_00860 [Mesorhizobium sp. LSJC269B00]